MDCSLLGRYYSARNGGITCLSEEIVKLWLSATDIDSSGMTYLEAVKTLHKHLKGQPEIALLFNTRPAFYAEFFPRMVEKGDAFFKERKKLQNDTALYFKAIPSTQNMSLLEEFDLKNVLNAWDRIPGIQFRHILYVLPQKPKTKDKETLNKWQQNSDRHAKELADELRDMIQNGVQKVAVVFNTSLVGSHWVTLWIDVPSKTIEFYNSLNHHTLDTDKSTFLKRNVLHLLENGLPKEFDFHVTVDYNRRDRVIQIKNKSGGLIRSFKETDKDDKKFVTSFFNTLNKKLQEGRLTVDTLAKTVDGTTKANAKEVWKVMAKFHSLSSGIYSYDVSRHQERAVECGVYSLWFIEQKIAGISRAEITNPPYSVQDDHMCAKRSEFFFADDRYRLPSSSASKQPSPPKKVEEVDWKALGIFSVATLATRPLSDIIPDSVLTKLYEVDLKMGPRSTDGMSHHGKWVAILKQAEKHKLNFRHNWVQLPSTNPFYEFKDGIGLYLKPFMGRVKLGDTDILSIMLPWEKYKAPDFRFYMRFNLKPGIAKLEKLEAAKGQPWARYLGTIYNTDAKGEGSHWVAVLIDRRTPTSSTFTIEYYDSLGHTSMKTIPEHILTSLSSKHSKSSKQEIIDLDSDEEGKGEKKEKTGKEEKVASKKKTAVFEIVLPAEGHQSKDEECGIFAVHYLMSRLQGQTIEQIRRSKMNDEGCKQLRELYYRNRIPTDQDIPSSGTPPPPPEKDEFSTFCSQLLTTFSVAAKKCDIEQAYSIFDQHAWLLFLSYLKTYPVCFGGNLILYAQKDEHVWLFNRYKDCKPTNQPGVYQVRTHWTNYDKETWEKFKKDKDHVFVLRHDESAKERNYILFLMTNVWFLISLQPIEPEIDTVVKSSLERKFSNLISKEVTGGTFQLLRDCRDEKPCAFLTALFLIKCYNDLNLKPELVEEWVSKRPEVLDGFVCMLVDHATTFTNNLAAYQDAKRILLSRCDSATIWVTKSFTDFEKALKDLGNMYLQLRLDNVGLHFIYGQAKEVVPCLVRQVKNSIELWKSREARGKLLKKTDKAYETVAQKGANKTRFYAFLRRVNRFYQDHLQFRDEDSGMLKIPAEYLRAHHHVPKDRPVGIFPGINFKRRILKMIHRRAKQISELGLVVMNDMCNDFCDRLAWESRNIVRQFKMQTLTLGAAQTAAKFVFARDDPRRFAIWNAKAMLRVVTK